MTDTAQPVLRFHSEAVPDDPLVVTRLEGQEKISRPYRFDLELVSANAFLDFGAILRHPAWLGIEQGILSPAGELALGLPLHLHGRLPSFEQIEKRDAAVVYRATLVPRLWKLSLSYQSRIFLDKTIPQVVEEVLKGAGFGPDDYAFDLGREGGYSQREYVVQYEESDLDFISRWLEHEGVFYFFEQSEDREKVVFADSVNSYPSIRSRSSLRFLPDPGKVVGIEAEKTWFREESVQSFSCRQETIPQKVILKDYNWRKPSLDLQCSADVDPEGEGTLYEYNNHFKTPEEGAALARVRAEEIRCRRTTLRGSGDCRAFRAGATWKLAEHFRDEFNALYLITEVRHLATQPVQVSTLRATRATYTNDFVCIPADGVFRPQRTTVWPAIRGAMHAKIDGSGSGQYAEIDSEGQYKVRLPLDLADREAGQASRYVRMAQPYAGVDHGMHFPLHKGTEVLLTHIDGDPDRPIITGAVPNAETGNVVRAGNQRRGGVRTAGGNELSMEDADGHQRIFLKAGSGKSAIAVGAGSGDRIDMHSSSTIISSTLANLSHSTFNNMTGLMSASLISGFPLLQALILALRTANDITNQTLIRNKLEEQSWGEPLASLVQGATHLVGNAAVTALKHALLSPVTGSLVKETARAMTEGRGGQWVEPTSSAFSKIKNAVLGIGSCGFGAVFARCVGMQNGSILKLSRTGENLLVGTNGGTLALTGQDLFLNAAQSAHLCANDFHVLARDSLLTMQPTQVCLKSGGQVITLKPLMIEMHSEQTLFLGAGVVEQRRDMTPAESTYVEMRKDPGINCISAQSHASMKCGSASLVLKKDAVHLTIGAKPQCGIQLKEDGTVSIFGKQIDFYADTIGIGDGSCQVLLHADSTRIVNQGALTTRSGSQTTINGHVVQPVAALARLSKKVELAGAANRAQSPV